MTNEVQYLPITYLCNGVTTEFSFNWNILEEKDILLILEDSGGNQTVLTLTSDYTVDFTLGAPGGIVVTNTAYALGNSLIVGRSRTLEQPVELKTSTGFQGRVLEEDVADNLSIQIQQNAYDGQRAIKQPVGATVELSAPTPVADGVWAYNSTADEIVTVSDLAEISVITSGLVNGDFLKWNGTGLEKAADNDVSSNAGNFIKVNSTGDGYEYSSASYPPASYLATCSTASSTAEKEITLSGVTLAESLTLIVEFDNANTASVPTINFNSTVDAIYDEAGNAVSATNPAYFPADAKIELYFDGTNWIFKKRIVETYINGTEWYRIYSDGWVEQGGATSAHSTVTFLIPFSNTNYFGVIQQPNSTGTIGASLIRFNTKTTTTAFISIGTWYACGY